MIGVRWGWRKAKWAIRMYLKDRIRRRAAVNESFDVLYYVINHCVYWFWHESTFDTVPLIKNICNLILLTTTAVPLSTVNLKYLSKTSSHRSHPSTSRTKNCWQLLTILWKLHLCDSMIKLLQLLCNSNRIWKRRLMRWFKVFDSFLWVSTIKSKNWG